MSLFAIRRMCAHGLTAPLVSSVRTRLVSPISLRLQALSCASLTSLQSATLKPLTQNATHNPQKLQASSISACGILAKRALHTDIAQKSHWNIPLTYDQVIAEAQEQFTDDPYKDYILKEIELQLTCYQNGGGISYERVRVYPTEFEQRRHFAVQERIEAFFDRKDLFRDVRITVHGGSIFVDKRSIYKVMAKAEEFVQNLSLSESKDTQNDRKQTLNVIRSIMYKRASFTSDGYLNLTDWLSTTDITKLPNKYALEFFKSHSYI